MTKIAQYLVNHPSVLHFIIAALPVTLTAALVIALPLWLIPGYFTFLEDAANQHPRPFIVAVILGLITSTCSLIWAGRKAWLETADLFPSNQEEPED